MTEAPIFAALEQVLPSLRQTYRDLHRHPELSLQEHRTAAVVEESLTGLGYAVVRIGGTGVVGVLENGGGSRLLARADMDALPILEASGVEYASQVEGVMHGCGHDLHTTALLGAATLLATHRQAWSGTYIALFQPAEETGAGARAMVADGLVDRIPRPDVAVGQHVMATAAGTLQTTSGPMLSASRTVTITVFGQGAHGSSPHLGVDPVVLASAIVMRLQGIVSRETAPGEFALVTVGALNAGTKANIIADRAVLKVNFRAYSEVVLARLEAAIERVVRGECEVSGSPQQPDFDYEAPFPLTDNDPDETARVAAAFVEHFGAAAVSEDGPYTASEDFSTIPRAFGIPYTFWAVGTVDPQRYADALDSATVLPGPHSPFFAPVIDPSLETAVRAQVVAALAHLGR